METKTKVSWNICPKCGALESQITWGDKEWQANCASQKATCNKCGCEFEEVYEYKFTEYEAEEKMPDIKDIDNLKFKRIKSFVGQHSFWDELGGYHRVAIADQSIIRRDNTFYQPQFADEGLLLVNFHALVESNYVMKEGKGPETEQPIWHLPVVDKDGQKFQLILVKEEYDWFMEYFA